ncbi:MAG: hypothetical protein A3D31_11355 [Candidatus Fluviicola riflensis]|nr:MAG: hypothetical protein CHH17_15780 [Candidatus Fluviicola riflensis]OGS77586.1 MAG: hypothetical protein A3D31_11355 [Candidatus Fluviicola riflensis]OGS84168.1 MAG: hypothetical protein A3E30_12760 [Fluviicola sp. RIFCSPHIGHO2_12_FULL_43_24]OGS84652.1 MAG: hypothetical protein A2724_08290 [Fluviicola sp. RIFCSPHIGHO2_01_FULL_43_53]
MKTILTTIFLLYACIVFSQTQLDSLSKVRSEQIKSKEIIESQIEETEKKIIAEILKNGYYHTLKTTYKGETFGLNALTGYNTILYLKDGDRIKVTGSDGIYLIVEFGDTIGKVFLSRVEAPLSLLTEFKYHEYIRSLQSSQKASSSSQSPQKASSSSQPAKTTNTHSSTCSSTQCSGTTQKKTRCKNMTTNCNGRCHLH